MTTAEERVQHVPGIAAEVWVEPTAEQWFWVRHFPRWFAARADGETGPIHWLGRATVVPSTNLTNFSLQYQSYLKDIFHLRWPSRLTHFVFMPMITALLLATLKPVRLGGCDGAELVAALFGCWWLAWALYERLWLWGLVSAAWAVALWRAAVFIDGAIAWPALWMVVLSSLQAASHSFEPQLPPRVTPSLRWLPTLPFLRAGLRGPLASRLQHVANVLATSIYGTVDELMASPRLAPIHLLEVLWLCGYKPSVRAEWKGLSARAVASGNPALDYIGVGGGTPLRWPGRV